MSTSLSTIDFPNILPINSHNEKFDATGDFVEITNAREAGNPEEMQVHDLYLQNFSVRTFKGTLESDTTFENLYGQGSQLMGSCLFLEGLFETHIRNRREKFTIGTGLHNFKFDPQNEFFHIGKSKIPFHFAHISIDPQYFMQLLPDEPWADKIKSRMIKGQRFVGERNASINGELQKALNLVLNCPLTGKLKQLMIETALVQITLLQITDVLAQQNANQDKQLAKRDIQLMTEVKEYLKLNFLKDHSIQSLAKGFGTNTNKLMMLFKRLFGVSLFEYIGELRMNYARQLINDEGLNVSQVAHTIGYKNAHHFSTAFKKRYGYSPSRLKYSSVAA